MATAGKPVARPGRDRLDARASVPGPAVAVKQRTPARDPPAMADITPYFFFTAIVFLHIAFAVEHADELHRFALRRDRIGDRQIDVGATDRFFGGFAAGNKFLCPRRFEKHVFRRHDAFAASPPHADLSSLRTLGAATLVIGSPCGFVFCSASKASLMIAPLG